MSQASKNWLFGKDEQDDLSVFIESYFHRMKADFVQLLAEPQEGGRFRNCYTFPGKRNFSYDFSIEHMRQVEELVSGSEVCVFEKNHIDGRLPETSFIRQLAYNRLVYLPIVHTNRQLGILCMYFIEDTSPDPVLLKSISHELGLLLVGHAGNYFRSITPLAIKICRELAFTRTRKQLSDLFDNSLKNYLGYKQSTIFLFDTESNLVKNFFQEFHLADPAYRFYDHVRLGKTPISEHFAPKIATTNSPEVLDVVDFDERTDIFPFLVKESEKLTNAVVYNLYGGDEIIGKWIVLFDNDGWTFQPGKPMLQFIASQLALAVARIHACEKLQKSEEENEIISSLNVDFASTKDKQNLLTIIHQKLAKLFDFSHSIVGLINEDDCTVNTFLRDTNSRARNHPRYSEVAYATVPLVDGILNKVLLSREPVVFDLEDLRNRGGMTDYMPMWYESGIRKVTICTLQARSKTIGFWYICHLEGQDMTVRQRELMKNISAQFSIAVDNIRVNEMILAKELETENLLKLSFDLTRSKTRDELKHTLRQHLLGLISFREMIIKVVAPSMDYYTLLAISSTNPAFEAECQKDAGKDFRCAAMNSDEPLIFDISRLLSKPDAEPSLLEEYERGIREKVGLCLKIEEQYYVVQSIHFDKKGACSDHTLQLIKGICYQVSFIVNNILANERTARREAERDLMLSLSNRMTTVRNSTDLKQVIDEHIWPIIGFDHSFVGVINTGQGTLDPLLPETNSTFRDHPLFKSVAGRPLHFHDGILDLACASPEPTTFDLVSMSGQPNFPDYLQLNVESGRKQVIAVRLGNGQKTTGLWLLFFNEPVPKCAGGFNFLKGLAAQISSAVFNVTSNFHIEQREWEKDRLVTFNDKIASVREKGALAHVIGEQLRHLLNIAGYIFLPFSEDKKSCFPYLFAMGDNFTANSELMLTGAEFSVRAPLFQAILSATGPVTIDLSQVEPEEPVWKILRITRAGGLETLMGQVLKVGEKEFGIVLIWPRDISFTDYQANLWKGVSAQMATAISNLIANEQIISQLEQIKTFKTRLEEEKVYLKEEIETAHDSLEIIGDSPEIKKVYRLVSQVAPSDSTVLILGETGTGKEVVARAIHNNSPRAGKLMVKVNCAALPANLIESELFGHERGSFTGATERRIGKFELANHGTLFLDEIGEMPPELQTKLLRALQEKEIERIGGKVPIKVDVRIIAATNRNLEKEMKEKRFRSDLFYRLNIFPVHLPPLRQRKEDIRILALHFIERFAKKTGKRINNLNARLLDELQQYQWPGNIRELEHIIERSILLSSGESLQHIDLPAIRSTNAVIDEEGDAFIPYTIDENERIHILKVLKVCNGKINGKAGAAAILGVPPSTLNSKMKRLNIKKQHIGETLAVE